MKISVNDPNNVPSLDINDVYSDVDFLVSNDGRTVWLNVDGVCIARVNNIPKFVKITASQDGSGAKLLIKTGV